MKKQLLTVAAIALFGMGSVYAQRSVAGKAASVGSTMQIKERCSTPAPDKGWDEAFNKLVEEFKAQQASAKMLNPNLPTVTNYTIPVVVHVIHGGQAVGTFPNISQTQVNSQITVLNNDYAGTGLNVANYPASAFTTYATNGNIPAANKDGSGRIKIANTGISFCMAVTDKNGNPMAEPGIDRVNYTTLTGTGAAPYPSQNPTTYTTATTFQNFINNIVKPQTVWDPVKYLNMWVTDENAAVGLLGYATFPAASTLTGIPGGSTGTATTDGFWAWAKAFGNTGTLSPPYNKGRTCTHEIGHWLGLRHIWGDNGQCGATDYCVDTPPQQGTTGPPAGCYYGQAMTYPQNANTCTRPDGVAGASITNVNGDMYMNFMDYSDDVAMYMFTVDQTARIQTAMANGTYRKFLGTHGLCSSTPQPPVANFNFPASICTGVAAAFTDASSGIPTSWAWSVSPSTGVTVTTATSQNPMITFNTASTYTVTLTATNAQGNNTVNKTVTVTTCTGGTVCDTLNTMNATDTLVCYTSGGGYVAGNNQYGDAQEANFYTDAGIQGMQITGAIALFYRNGSNGTKGTTGTVPCQILGGNNTSGPSGAALVSASATLSSIVATTSVMNIPYCGDPNIGYATAIIKPYKYTFATPLTVPVGGFFVNLVAPTTTGDTMAIFTNTQDQVTTNTAWLENSGVWYPYTDGTNGWGGSFSLGILPIVCPSTGIHSNVLESNIAMFPNPTSGLINFATTLPFVSDLTISATNSLGQVVSSKVEKNVSSGIISLDLAPFGKGVYFVTVSMPSGEKVIRKIVVQ
ncbi:MAG: T9SS type A sorting domain-containing protein [Bacteroidia bacterium]